MNKLLTILLVICIFACIADVQSRRLKKSRKSHHKKSKTRSDPGAVFLVDAGSSGTRVKMYINSATGAGAEPVFENVCTGAKYNDGFLKEHKYINDHASDADTSENLIC